MMAFGKGVQTDVSINSSWDLNSLLHSDQLESKLMLFYSSTRAYLSRK